MIGPEEILLSSCGHPATRRADALAGRAQSYVAPQSVCADYGSFDARTREAIALAVGNVDECSYCQAAHTGGGKAAGLSDDEMIAIRRDAVEFDAKLAAPRSKRSGGQPASSSASSVSDPTPRSGALK